MRVLQGLLLMVGMVLGDGALAIDSELYQKYQMLKSRQQDSQLVALEQARAALQEGDLETAESKLATARHLAYAPDQIAAMEQAIADERDRQEQQRIARAEAERKEKERLARAEARRQASESRATASTSTGSGSSGRLVSSLDWGYEYNDIYVPPTYESELKRRGIFFPEYYLETRQTMSGYTISDLEKVYFAVKLKNTTNNSMRVTYKISAREQFSVGRAVGTTANAAGWGLVGAALGSLFGDGDPDAVKAGAALGGAYGVARQSERNEWFEKSKTFTRTLDPGEEVYETGVFPVSQRLSNSPKLEIISVN